MGVTDWLRSQILNWLLLNEDSGLSARLTRYAHLGDYARGSQARQLKAKTGQTDDNLTLNFTGLVIDRSISLLFGGGVEFDLPDGTEGNAAVYLDGVWRANKRAILLHKLAWFGAVYGTCYCKIMPDSYFMNGASLPRLVALNPAWMSIQTDAEDMEHVTGYVLRYIYNDQDGEVARKEETLVNESGAGWIVNNYEASSRTRSKWEQTSSETWPFDFPPIVHWQNLPDPESEYGISDVEGIVEAQDRLNFVESNVSKIIRYHAHPKTWGAGFTTTGRASWGPDEMITLNGSDGRIQNLEMQSDLSSSRAFALDLRQSLFDISRTVDLSSVADKLGSLTNFGLRVLYMDALAKLGTKRELYGDGLSEINRRLLEIANVQPVDGGVCRWPEALPVNRLDLTNALTQQVGAGLVSKETASGELGRDWAIETERMQGEQAAGDNVGAAILRAFERGGQEER